MTACEFGDPYCPCQDGDGCNYEDDEASGTKGLTVQEMPHRPIIGLTPPAAQEKA